MEINVSELSTLIHGAPPATKAEMLSTAIVAPTPEDLGLQIVILQRGWVVVGNVRRCGDEHIVSMCHVIRIWGTTKGLGEIALGGPTSTTKLDGCGTLRADTAGIVAMVGCTAEKWKGVIS